MSEPLIRPAATVAVLRDGDDGLQVLLLRRGADLVFGPGAHVYPGGALDAADRAPETMTGYLMDSASATTAGPHGDRAYRIAAIRECFEEAGLLVACVDAVPDAAERQRLRADLNAGRADWPQTVARLGVAFAADALIYFDAWQTPPGAPKRYATRFFAVRAPSGQSAAADGHETDRVFWARPADAVVRDAAGQLKLMTPTRATLAALARYADVDSALAGLAESAPPPCQAAETVIRNTASRRP